jgi:hypothetical protein
VEKKKDRNIPVDKELVKEGKLLAPLKVFKEFTLRFDDDSIAGYYAFDEKE